MHQRILVALLVAILTISAITVFASSPTYLGCYSDRADVLKRALPLLQEISQEMTVEKCLQKCASLGFEFTGLEYKHECYCGNKSPPYEQLKEEQCDVTCGGGGDRKCGGALSLSVYKQEVTQPTFDADRPLVCLVMILKDEAHTVLNTLRAVKDYIDCWQILDTGSKDGTQNIIQDYFANNPSNLPELKGKPVPGQLYEEPFVDYGATRNRILILAKEHPNPIFTLMLSADEEMKNPADMRAFLKEVRYARGSQHGAYPVVMNTGLKFDSVRLARVDALWRYRGRVHEYLSPPDGPYIALYRSPIAFDVQFNATDGPRRFQSQFFIRRILEEDLAKNPNDTRSIYYLARTNSGINNHSEAYRYYDMLTQRSHWDEEIYHGMVMKALESKYLNIHWHERQTMLLDAFNYKPNNMDALHALAQDHFDSGRFQLAYVFALRAVQLPMPPGLAAIENVLLRPTKYLYDYEGQRLLGFAAREIGEWSTCLSAYQHVLKVNPQDTIVQDRIKLCEKEYAASGKYVQPAIHPEPIGAAVATELEEDLEKDPSKAKLNIPGSIHNPKLRVARARRDSAVRDGDDGSDLGGLHDGQHHRFSATGGTIHLDVSINYLLLLTILVLGGMAAIVLKALCATGKKVKV